MTKNELYNTLLDEGVKLPPLAKLSKADLEKKYAELHPEAEADAEDEAEETAEPEKAAEEPIDFSKVPTLADILSMADDDSAQVEDEGEATAPTPPMLYFANAGWCDELNRSYFIGWYQAQSWNEYNALKKYASEEV